MSIRWNDGLGGIASVETLAVVSSAGVSGIGATSPVAFDADGDGDLDLGVCIDGRWRYLMNLSRQIDLRQNPGRTPLTFDLHLARGGTFLPIAAAELRPVSEPTPFGRFQLDETTAVLLPPVQVAPGVPFRYEVDVPTSPALVGLEAHIQGFVDPIGQRPRLTNRITARVGR